MVGEEEEEKTTGWRLCDTYIRQCGSMANIKPDAVEVSVEADLFQHGLPRLIGILDLVQEGTIIDFKTSRKPKKAEYITNYFMQEAFYAAAFYERTGVAIKQIVTLVMVDHEEPQVFIEQPLRWLPDFLEARKKFARERGI